MAGEGPAAKARVDIGMRLVPDVENYRDVGTLMDDIQDAIAPLLGGHKRSRFDFTHFQTRPCKAGKMAHLAQQAVPFEDDVPEETF